jgi:hypothetical protein
MKPKRVGDLQSKARASIQMIMLLQSRLNKSDSTTSAIINDVMLETIDGK